MLLIIAVCYTTPSGMPSVHSDWLHSNCLIIDENLTLQQLEVVDTHAGLLKPLNAHPLKPSWLIVYQACPVPVTESWEHCFHFNRFPIFAWWSSVGRTYQLHLCHCEALMAGNMVTFIWNGQFPELFIPWPKIHAQNCSGLGLKILDT